MNLIINIVLHKHLRAQIIINAFKTNHEVKEYFLFSAEEFPSKLVAERYLCLHSSCPRFQVSLWHDMRKLFDWFC